MSNQDPNNPVKPTEVDDDFTYTTVGDDSDVITPNFEEESEIDRISKEYGIDPEFIQVDALGKVISITDPKTGETFFTDDDADETSDLDKVEEPKNTDPDNKNNTPVTYINKLDEVLKKAGLDVTEIEFEDGSKKSLKDLTEEEQIEILAQQVKFQQTQLPTLSEDEEKLVKFLRSGKTARELAETILESDQSYKYSKMSDEDVFRDWLKKERPTYTEDEIEDEIKDLRERNKLGREAKAIRAKYDSTAQIPEVKPDESFIAQKEEIVNFAKGVQVDPKIKNEVLSFIVPSNDLEDSELIKYLSTPEALFNVGYLLTQYENIVKHYEQKIAEAEEIGRKKALGQLA